jgi:type VI secretion system protein ImpK
MTPSTSTAWFSPTPAPPPPALAPVPAPPLKALLEDGFGLLALLRNGAWPQREDFRARLEALLGQFERRAQALGKPPEAVQEAKYAFCALADEILLGADSPLRDSWGGAPLQLSLFGEHLAGEGFFRRLEQLRQDPAARLETLEVFHMCLLLGFQGKYLLDDPERLHWLTARLGEELARHRGEAPFAPHALPGFRFAGPGRRSVPLWGYGALLAGAALSLFLGFTFLLGTQTSALAERAERPR